MTRGKGSGHRSVPLVRIPRIEEEVRPNAISEVHEIRRKSAAWSQPSAWPETSKTAVMARSDDRSVAGRSAMKSSPVIRLTTLVATRRARRRSVSVASRRRGDCLLVSRCLMSSGRSTISSSASSSGKRPPGRHPASVTAELAQLTPRASDGGHRPRWSTTIIKAGDRIRTVDIQLGKRPSTT